MEKSVDIFSSLPAADRARALTILAEAAAQLEAPGGVDMFLSRASDWEKADTAAHMDPANADPSETFYL
jgi:hypothetical protein